MAKYIKSVLKSESSVLQGQFAGILVEMSLTISDMKPELVVIRVLLCGNNSTHMYSNVAGVRQLDLKPWHPSSGLTEFLFELLASCRWTSRYAVWWHSKALWPRWWC